MAAFVAVGAANLPLDERYALPTTILTALYFGVFVAGWQGMTDGWRKRSWIAAAVALLAVAVATAPSSVRALSRDRGALDAQGAVARELGPLVRLDSVRTAIARCGPLQASYRIVPLLAYVLDRNPRTIVTVNSGVPANGIVVQPARGLAQELFEAPSYADASFRRRRLG